MDSDGCFPNYVWVDKFSTAAAVELLHVQISCRFYAPAMDFDCLAASSFASSFLFLNRLYKRSSEKPDFNLVFLYRALMHPDCPFLCKYVFKDVMTKKNELFLHFMWLACWYYHETMKILRSSWLLVKSNVNAFRQAFIRESKKKKTPWKRLIVMFCIDKEIALSAKCRAVRPLLLPSWDLFFSSFLTEL